MLTDLAEVVTQVTEDSVDLPQDSIVQPDPQDQVVKENFEDKLPPNVKEVNLDSVTKELRDYMNLISTEAESAELKEEVLTVLAVYDDYQVSRLMRTKVKEAAEALVRNRILGVNVDAIVQQVTRAYSTVTPVSETDAAAFSGLANYIIQVLDSDLKLGPTKIKNILFLSMFVGLKK